MSKNIVIQENGVAQTLNSISKINTDGYEGGSVDWVPEDTVKLGIATIKKNGTYKASSKGFYAFSEANVSASGKATGKDKSGNWKTVMDDGEGNLIEKGLPVRIEVVTPPTKTSYIPLEPINKAGMVVEAYFDDDSEWGVISLDEITIDPIVAPSGGDTYAVSVKWKRHGDEAELTSSFEITVTPPINPIGG